VDDALKEDSQDFEPNVCLPAAKSASIIRDIDS
jgi:hypothetical protein